MARRNVTLTLSDDALRQARHLAAEKGISLSQLLSESLEQVVSQSRRYADARLRALARMKRGFNLGVKDKPGWTRDELHDR